MADSLVEIGRITRSHGLKGEVRVESWAESLDIFSGMLWLADGKNPLYSKKVIGAKMHQNHVLLRLEGIDDRTAAETLRGVTVLKAASSLPELSDGDVYLHQLVGLTVIDDVTKEAIGALERVDLLAGQEIWVIRTAKGQEILFPAVEEFVTDIDPDAGKVWVAPPPGLLELYLA